MQFEFDFSKGATPLYMQLAVKLEAHIEAQHLVPGTKLPSEPELARENSVSRATVLKAYEYLVEKGLVVRRQGKGSFVNREPMERRLPELTSFTSHILGAGGKPSGELLAFEDVDTPTEIGDGVLRELDAPIVRMLRLRIADGDPVGLQETFVPQWVCERLHLTEGKASDEQFSFYSSLTEANIYLQRGEETLTAVNAEPEEADYLGVPKGSALIQVDRASRDSSGSLVEFVRAKYLGSRYLYRVSLTNQNYGGNHEALTSNDARRPGGDFANFIDSML
jgi:GntR family transcriptional regulator